MTTLIFKVWIITAFLCMNTPLELDGATKQEMVCINLDARNNRTAFMDGQKNIRYIAGTAGWADGDVVTVTMDAGGNITGATKQGQIYRYHGNGYFTEVHYPWWYTGNRPTELKVNPTPMRLR